MATFMVLLELDEAAPMKTLTSLHNMPGIVDISMNLDRPPAELKRLMREASAANGAQLQAPGAPKPKARDIILQFLAKHGGSRLKEIGVPITGAGMAYSTCSTILTALQRDGEVRRTAAGLYQLTAKGRKAVAGAANGAAAPVATKGERGGWGQEEALALLKKLGGSTTLARLQDDAVSAGKTRLTARQTVERLKAHKAVTIKGKGPAKVIQMKKESTANAAS